MVIIFSNIGDHSTSQVISWLLTNKINFLRINSEEVIKIIKLSLNNIEFEYRGNNYSLRNFNSFWYRRGNFNIPYSINSNSQVSKKIQESLLSKEQAVLIGYLHRFIEDKSSNKVINSFFNAQVNKLTVLRYALELGLDIPDTEVIVNPMSVKNKNCYIIKSTAPDSMIEDEFGDWWHIYTNEFDFNEDVESFPFMIQKKIVKDFEIRCFYLHGVCYSMAIFSQYDEKTKIDFRRYNWSNPVRKTPFKLPQNIEIKINNLMNKLNLKSGSLDFIVKGSKYFFLEVNPVGQFGMVSYPCNYYLEKLIAEKISLL
jgi:ATP-GRASP peptide maturase of grasp-with-spasm system